MLHTGFPKTSSVFTFQILQSFTSDTFEWQGRVTMMNCVAHLSKMDKTPLFFPVDSRPDLLDDINDSNSDFHGRRRRSLGW